MISIGSSYRHLEEYKSLNNVAERRSLRVRITQKTKKLINLKLVNGDSKEVDIDSLKKYISYESNILIKFMNLKEFANLLRIEVNDDKIRLLRKSINKLEGNSPFECIEVDYPINYQTFYISRLSVENFFENYVPVKYLKDKYNYSSWGWSKKLKKFRIRPLFLSYDKQFITKSEFEILENDCASKTVISESKSTVIKERKCQSELNFNTRDIGIYLPDYYTLEESRKILSVKVLSHFSLIAEEYHLVSKVARDSSKYFKKEDIDKLKALQTKLREQYITSQEAKEIANVEGFIFNADYISGEPINSLLRPFFKSRRKMYSKEVFYKWLEERRNYSNFFTLSTESDFNTFKIRLNIKKIDLAKLGTFTSETWQQFIYSRLSISKANPQSKDANINKYVYCTEKLINLVSLTSKYEIYSITSNEINTLFNEIQKNYSTIIYLYLKQVYNNLNRNKIKTFDINKVNNPRKFFKETNDKSIYEFDVYKKVYNYAKDISLHKTRAIKDVIKEFSVVEGTRNIEHYSSSWLYVLLHLNNAWRHSDVITFPQVNLSGTQISDLNWLLENELSDEDVDYIIKQVYRTELTISKTQVKNYFFCSEELKRPIATSIAICQLRINALYPLYGSIIDFGNKKQNFSDSRRRNFFELYDDQGFYFSSRKMNRSLLTYIYVILSKMQKGTAGLKTIQKMRGHVEKETTNMYVDIPEEELNFLTRQLFSRGAFGFIYDTFLDVIQGVEIDREKRTLEIQFLDKYFGSIYKVEKISGFLNVIQNDRKGILDRILSMGLDEAIEFLNKIESNQLPSKQDNVQCLVAESGCLKIGKGVSCFDCAYSIPNYYALSTLGASLQERMNNYIETPKKEFRVPYFEERKRARLFYIQLELFAQAFQRFGMDVYEFIADSREEFLAKQAKISSLDKYFQLT